MSTEVFPEFTSLTGLNGKRKLQFFPPFQFDIFTAIGLQFQAIFEHFMGLTEPLN